MEALRSAWVHEVDLARLMNPPWRTGARSLLDERAMEKVVTRALDDMEKGSRTEPLVNVMDLHVPSTDLHGRPGVFRDFLGSRVRTREHGKVFRFRFRTKGYNPVDRDLGYQHDDFGPKTNRLLALICRATSAFPLAFRPLELVRGEQTDQLFEPGDGQVAYYSDGGILDNKPFTTAIKAIFSRAASHKVDRVLFFVEPDPRTPAEEEKETRPAEPGPLQVLLKAASAIPRHDSIAADLEAARDRGRRIREFRAILDGLESLINQRYFPKVAGMEEAEYRRFLRGQAQFEGYRLLKVDTLKARLRRTVQVALPQSPGAVRAFADEIGRMARNQVGGFLEAFDVEFRVRKYYRLIEILNAAYERRGMQEHGQKMAELERRLWASLDKVRSVEWQAWFGTDGKEPCQFGSRVRGLQGLEGERLGAEVSGLLNEMQACMSGRLKEISAEGLATAQEIDQLLAGANVDSLTSGPEAPSFETLFCRFEVVDMFLYPAIEASDLGERDPIELVRISPEDAHLIDVRREDKLAGELLFHFGGFLKREWRANDILWGRLDAAEIISRTVLKAAGVQERETVTSCVRRAQEEIVRQEVEAYKPEKHAPDYVSFLESHLKPVGSQGLKDVGLLYRTRLISLGLPALANMVFDLSLAGLVSSVLAGLLFSTLLPLVLGLGFFLASALEGLKVIIASPLVGTGRVLASPLVGAWLMLVSLSVGLALIVAVLVAIVFVLPVRTLVGLVRRVFA